ncbi:hypothetical protein M409DRAFT_22537 [Zasmidium cellare ATCC 36951]|uniref:Uncharacterized protein n=1 Tax=Zasmidium cellare ATCC 36951 TaxID=1080233 RepID=A0A6A6CKH0_ZASCE|nr:uncharacterized protein M409DRAFT_22537 [Zasmidium cellare ATCC 36951]KAF2167103.1 hypothetical protein M409DRAFT_22537 [Zasmidium cellare ATCC 36951]
MEYTADVPSQQAPDDTGMPTYMIYRDVRPGEPFDPSAPLHFLPPKDSDELFDALRFAFPHLKTHSERLRDATIKFLLEEQHAYTATPPPPAPVTAQPVPQTLTASATPTASTSSSTLNVWNHATVGTKGKFKHVPSSTSGSQPSSLLTKDMPPQEDMTGVFSISSVQPKQHQRRRMTEKEKADYRKRRMIKACDKCAKRKRKCIHNFAGSMSPQPEQNPSRRNASKATSDISSPNSIDSQDQSLREASQDNVSLSSQFANEDMQFDFSSNNEPMDGVSGLQDSSYTIWDIQNAANFAADMIDPALQIPSLGTWPVRTGACEQDWTSQDQIMADWAIDFPPAPVTPPILRMDEFLQFGEVFPEQWQVPWNQDRDGQTVPFVHSAHGEEEYVLPEDNEWCISRHRRLVGEKHRAVLQGTLSASRLRQNQETMGEDDTMDDVRRHRSLTYYGHPLQKPEKDPKIAADDASYGGEPFDVQEMVVCGHTAAAVYAWRCEAYGWVFETLVKNASTFASVLTLVASLLRQGEKSTALNGWPMVESPQIVEENDGEETVVVHHP